MPTAFKRYAVDFDGDGRRDVVELGAGPDRLDRQQSEKRRLGDRPDLGLRGRAAAELRFLHGRPHALLSIREWQKLGVQRAGGKAFPRGDERASLLLPAGARGPAFLMLPNFRVIMKYNPAEAYALAIGHLADRLRGGGPFVHAWPRDERVLTLDERYELQQLLARRGFDVGNPDGLLGPRTRVAIRNFQVSVGLIPDGFASSDVLDRLRQP